MHPSTDSVPAHIAIIMDGNGRWAKQRGLPRLKGHEAGAETVRCVMRYCRDAGVRHLTLYAFSTENWARPPAEVLGLMVLLQKFIRDNEPELHEHQVRLRVIGRRSDLKRPIVRELERVERATAAYTRGQLILALSYSGRSELVQATRAIAEEVQRGVLRPEDIDEGVLTAHLYAPDVPDPDLIVRTSGEMRISNFLLWQCSYSEFYVTPVLWPDFREPDFRAALDAFCQRRRRYGLVEEKDARKAGN
ncbi:MAG: polyprenyl diphosphate synthase [bacterium]